MKKKFFISMCVLMFCAFSVSAAKKNIEYTDEELDLANTASQIQKVEKPYLKGNDVIFTFPFNCRHVGIAFDFEDYKTVHSYMLKKITDMDGEVSDSFYFYVLNLPKNIKEFNYRIITDGLWILDPLNSETVYDENTELMLSHFNANREIKPVTEKTSSGSIRFVYQGETGKIIRLAGSFTNWDSWIYELQEVKKGLYTFELNLPPGKYEYAYFSGFNSFPDISNPNRCYSNDGKVASLLIVE